MLNVIFPLMPTLLVLLQAGADAHVLPAGCDCTEESTVNIQASFGVSLLQRLANSVDYSIRARYSKRPNRTSILRQSARMAGLADPAGHVTNLLQGKKVEQSDAETSWQAVLTQMRALLLDCSASKAVMSSWLIAAVALLLCGLCLCIYSPRGFFAYYVEGALDPKSTAVIGKQAPDFAMTLIDRASTTLSAFLKQGKPVLIKFISIHSQDCDVSCKAMDKLANHHLYRHTIICVLVAINHPTVTEMEKHKEKVKLSDKCVQGNLKKGWEAKLEEYGVRDVPHTTLIDAKGNVVKNYEGFSSHYSNITKSIDLLLKEAQPKHGVTRHGAKRYNF